MFIQTEFKEKYINFFLKKNIVLFGLLSTISNRIFVLYLHQKGHLMQR